MPLTRAIFLRALSLILDSLLQARVAHKCG
jgi:hypothetical protein